MYSGTDDKVRQLLANDPDQLVNLVTYLIVYVDAMESALLPLLDEDGEVASQHLEEYDELRYDYWREIAGSAMDLADAVKQASF